MVQSRPITLKFKGVLEKPGIHKNRRTGQDERIIWEELVKEAILYPRVPIVVNPSKHYGHIDPEDALGYAGKSVNWEKHKIFSTHLFFKERYDEVPEGIRKKLAAGIFVPASLTYTARVDETGIQRGRKPDHLLVGVTNPMHAGIGIHAESDLPDNLRWEETDGIGEEGKVPEKPSVQSRFSVAELNYMTDEIWKRLESHLPKPAEKPVSEPQRLVAVEEPKEPETPVPEKEEEVAEEEQPVEEPRHEPEKTIPKGKPAIKGIFEEDGSRRVISTPITGGKKE